MARTRRQASTNEMRARQLLAGAAAGGHFGAIIVVAAFWLFAGPAAGLSAAVAAAVTLAFNIIGQAVQVIMADAPAKNVLLATLASYGLRVTVLGLLLGYVLANQHLFVGMDAVAVVVATITVVLTWLSAEFLVYSRLRIPVFDMPEDHPPTGPNRM